MSIDSHLKKKKEEKGLIQLKLMENSLFNFNLKFISTLFRLPNKEIKQTAQVSQSVFEKGGIHNVNS